MRPALTWKSWTKTSKNLTNFDFQPGALTSVTTTGLFSSKTVSFRLRPVPAAASCPAVTSGRGFWGWPPADASMLVWTLLLRFDPAFVRPVSIFDWTLRLRVVDANVEVDVEVDVEVEVLLTTDPAVDWRGLDRIRYLSDVWPDLFSGGADPVDGATDGSTPDLQRRTLCAVNARTYDQKGLVVNSAIAFVSWHREL